MRLDAQTGQQSEQNNMGRAATSAESHQCPKDHKLVSKSQLRLQHVRNPRVPVAEILVYGALVKR